MSRIIVTNIPKFVSEKELKEHFKNLGQITDCKIVKNQKGESRKFAFVGFKDKNAAGLAQKNYDKTYIGVSKIRVEKARTRDQEEKGTKNKANSKENKKGKKSEAAIEQKFNEYKKIVQESVKKSWDDLVVPETSLTTNKK